MRYEMKEPEKKRYFPKKPKGQKKPKTVDLMAKAMAR